MKKMYERIKLIISGLLRKVSKHLESQVLTLKNNMDRFPTHLCIISFIVIFRQSFHLDGLASSRITDNRISIF